jgi:hypothetical protein
MLLLASKAAGLNYFLSIYYTNSQFLTSHSNRWGCHNKRIIEGESKQPTIPS